MFYLFKWYYNVSIIWQFVFFSLHTVSLKFIHVNMWSSAHSFSPTYSIQFLNILPTHLPTGVPLCCFLLFTFTHKHQILYLHINHPYFLKLSILEFHHIMFGLLCLILFLYSSLKWCFLMSLLFFTLYTLLRCSLTHSHASLSQICISNP